MVAKIKKEKVRACPVYFDDFARLLHSDCLVRWFFLGGGERTNISRGVRRGSDRCTKKASERGFNCVEILLQKLFWKFLITDVVDLFYPRGRTKRASS